MWKITSALFTVLFATTLFAQQTTLKEGSAKPREQGVSGKDMFLEYCASCHGHSGNGDGPAGPAFKVPPSNLRTLSAHNGGQFPEERVTRAIETGGNVTAHGSQAMPTWGTVFSWTTDGSVTDQKQAEYRVRKLTDYIKTLQTR